MSLANPRHIPEQQAPEFQYLIILIRNIVPSINYHHITSYGYVII